MITVQAFSDKLQPDACGKPTCVKGGKALMFYTSLYLLALGQGGVRGALPALGADQFDHKNHKGAKSLATYFNWFVLGTTLGVIVGVTGLVWVSMNKDWSWGFLIGTITSFVGFIALALRKPLYIVRPLGHSPITRVAQVIVVAIRNTSLSLPKSPDEYEINETERDPSEEKVSHTNQFRSLDKASILPDDMNPQPWRVCTVTQVEEVKILTKNAAHLSKHNHHEHMPIPISNFLRNPRLHDGPTLGPSKHSLRLTPVIHLVFMSIIPAYEYLVVPFARKITGHPSGITQLQRVGVGLVLSAMSMTIAGIVEVKRINQALKDPTSPISLFWLSFQYGISGVADMFTMVGLLEFFYKAAPSGTRSLSTSFAPLSLSFGVFLSTVFVEVINSVTKRIAPSKQGWLEGQGLDQSNLNLFYWFFGYT
ncbi:hypothetical protein Acr_28g0013090 [Actinidia rufa]|uniref:Major facilitator superfamily protein n=1 Tax=Actinidia rufa TaxID=165716 RepID=A0A7J0HD14_9ERIC|nr:hypothetical protein Acr_28g0013090 [Actinidia rufa]